MRLQLALDAPEHFGVLGRVADLVDIVEIGTPLLKACGTSAVAAARRLAPGVPILADTKTVDAGAVEAEIAFGCGATFMTVLSVASPETLHAAFRVASLRGCAVVVDTIAEPDPAAWAAATPLPDGVDAYVGLHRGTDRRLAARPSHEHIRAARQLARNGIRTALAGGIAPSQWGEVLDAAPDIVVVGSAITEAGTPREVAQWMRERMT